MRDVLSLKITYVFFTGLQYGFTWCIGKRMSSFGIVYKGFLQQTKVKYIVSESKFETMIFNDELGNFI